MDYPRETLVGLVAPHGDSLELLQTAEEVLDQMPPFVDLAVDRERGSAVWPLRDDDLGASLVQLVDDPVGVERCVGDQAFELDVLDQGLDTDRIVAISWQQDEADQVAECISQSQDFGGPAALGAANRLALSPPFAP